MTTELPRNPDREEIIHSFFHTHDGEMVVVPGVSPDQLPEKIMEILPALLESNIVAKLFQLDGLKHHKTSMFALLDCLFNYRCDACNGVPVIYEGAMFSKDGMNSFTEDGQMVSTPATGRMSVIQEGYHFMLNGHCAKCDRSRYVIASQHPAIIPVIKAFVTEAHGLKYPEVNNGFIAFPSWADTYFKKKQYDKAFAKRTLQKCTQTLFHIKKSAQARHLSLELRLQEIAEVIQDDLQSLLPEVKDEREFCGLIKGVLRYSLLFILSTRNLIPALTPKQGRFDFHQILKQAQIHIPTVDSKMKKKLIVIAIVLVAEAYQTLTNSALPIPVWVQRYYEEHFNDSKFNKNP